MKPENLLITYAGHVKLTEFGSAKGMRSASPTPTADLSEPLSSGAVSKLGVDNGPLPTFVGSPLFVSPKVLLGSMG
jgi:serine/threonine protein kinase